MRRKLMKKGADIVIRLRELRRVTGLSQKDVAELAGLGEKTISSFETGTRVDTMKVGQLSRLLMVYGVSESEFFSDDFDELLLDEDAFRDSSSAIRGLMELPSTIREGLLERIGLMVQTATHVHSLEATMPFLPARTSDWETLNSRN